MKQTLIVLRSRPASRRDAAAPRDPSRGVPAEAATAVDVDVVDVERREIPELLRRSDVVAAAPSIPMRLIEPLDVREAPPATSANEWGIEAVGAHVSPFTGDGIVVAVLDTGIDATHPAFAGVDLDRKDFTGTGLDDANGHGTHCAGTIFGRTLDGRRFGIAQGVRRALIGKVLGERGGSSESIATAIQWAMQEGANVISMSLGMDFPGLVEYWQSEGLPVVLATSRALEAYRANVRLFEQLAALVQAESPFRQPAIIVAAAGNESRRDLDADFEIAVAPPAVAEGIVSVAAVGPGPRGLVVAPFSNTGAIVSAPGVDVVSARAGGGLVTMSGTSMAAPHVAGVAALWAQKLATAGSLTPLQLASRLIGTAGNDALAPGTDPFDVGAGVVRAPQA